MPKQSQTQLQPRPQVAQQASGRRVQSQVSPANADNVPAYIPEMKNPEVEGLLRGLSQFQPSLEKWADQESSQASEQGRVDKLAGKEQQSSHPAYVANYFTTDGYVRAKEDASQIIQKYNTEFDKDKGDLEGWIAENYGTRLNGMSDENFISGYNKGITPALQEIRKAHLAYQREAVQTRVESNAMQMLDGGVRAYVSHGMPIPDGYIDSIRTHMGENLGVSGERFNELLFATVKRVGDEGHWDAYDVLKKDNADGSPGLYYDPKFKEKIDAAQLHSFSLAEARGAKMREDKQNEKLYSVFAEEDPKKAQAMYTDLKKSGLFTRADDLIKWDKLMLEKVDGKPDNRQLEYETNMLSRIYKGGVSPREIIDARSAGNLTASQTRSLLGETRRVTHENQMVAAQQGKADEAIFKTHAYRSAEDFLEGMLQPRPPSPTDINGVSVQFDRVQLAQAKLELAQRSRGKSPEEVQDMAAEISDRYIRRRSNYAKERQERIGAGGMPFKSLQEVVEAARRDLLSLEELRMYSTYFKTQHQ